MKKLLLTLSIIALAISVKSQTYLNHGIGAHLGFNSESRRTVTPEYELDILSDKKGYTSGFITGIGVSIPVKNENRDLQKAFYLKGGYRLSSLSFGVNAGTQNVTENYESYYKTLVGAWVGLNVVRSLKIQAGGDSFNGFNIGLIFLPNTIKGNR